VNLACLLGLDAFAVTDHNSIKNAAAVLKAAEGRSLIVLPGMELETEEEAHVVCLFPDLSSAAAFEGALGPYFNTDLKNNPSIYGDQLIMSEPDEILGTEERLLSAATRLSVDHAAKMAEGCGGAAFPAHVDRPSFSVLSNLGFVAPEMGFKSLELSADCDAEAFLQKHPALAGYRILRNSDAHCLERMSLPVHFLEASERSPLGIIALLRKYQAD
jgi:PHP family Zn ribbon phosphoesterase